MRLLLLFSFFFLSCASYKTLHRSAVVVDTHNDVISSATMKGLNIENNLAGKTHSDLGRLKKGGVDVQVFSIFCDEKFGRDTAFKFANIELDSLHAIAARNPGSVAMVTTPAALQQAVAQHKLACMAGVEGGHMMEDNLAYLDSFYKRGVRYMTLTWNNSTSWATSAMDETQRKDSLPFLGLTAFGKDVVRRMNALGMMVDLSHVGERTFWDAIETTTRPVIVSHSCVYALCPVFRNLKDDQLKAVARNGGVVHVNFYSGFLDSAFQTRAAAFNAQHKAESDSLKGLGWSRFAVEEQLLKQYPGEAQLLNPPLSVLIDHIDYMVRLIGADHVGIGSDFDGISSTPKGMNDVTALPLLTRALLKKGFSKADVRKILGENFLRVFAANAPH